MTTRAVEILIQLYARTTGLRALHVINQVVDI
jgi:hypothetical protein